MVVPRALRPALISASLARSRSAGSFFGGVFFGFGIGLVAPRFIVVGIGLGHVSLFTSLLLVLVFDHGGEADDLARARLGAKVGPAAGIVLAGQEPHRQRFNEGYVVLVAQE